MLPLLTFASGLLAGVVGVRLIRTARTPERVRKAAAGLGTVGDKVRQGVDQAQSTLRQAAVSGLGAVEQTSAGLRAKLGDQQPAPAAAKPAKTRRAKLAETASPVAEAVQAEAAPAPKLRKVRAQPKPAAGAAQPRRARKPKAVETKPPGESGEPS